MKTNRILILAVAFAAAALTSTSFAQAADKPARGERAVRGERAEKMREHMAKELNLSADQQTRIEAIHAVEREQRQAIIADTNLAREEKREKIAALREATVQQVDGVLTPEQQAKAKEMRAKAKEHGGKMKERGEKMKERRERRQSQN